MSFLSCPVYDLTGPGPQAVQFTTCPVHKLNSPRVGSPQVSISSSCPVTIKVTNLQIQHWIRISLLHAKRGRKE